MNKITRELENMRIIIKPQTIARLEEILDKRIHYGYDSAINQVISKLQERKKL